MPEEVERRADGGREPAQAVPPYEDGAGSVFLRVLVVSASASVPTALVDLGLVRGDAGSAALVLAVALVLAGVGSLFFSRPEESSAQSFRGVSRRGELLDAEGSRGVRGALVLSYVETDWYLLLALVIALLYIRSWGGTTGEG